MTTRMRGRLERAEAWRNRLLEAADDLNQTLVQALGTWGPYVASVARGEVRIRDESGRFTRKTTAEMRAAEALLHEVRVRLGRLELLFSRPRPSMWCTR
jgi:hypothetical protein